MHISFFGILVLLCVFGFTVFAIVRGSLFAYNHRRQPLITLLFIIAVVALAAGSLMGIRTSRMHHPPIGVASHDGRPAAVVAVPGTAVNTEPSTDPTLEALWDKLTKSRINLDADSQASAADSQSEEAKSDANGTVELDDKGKSPPKWVTTTPKWVGQVYRETVASEPFVTEEECRRNLEQVRLPEAVARRIASIASSRAGRKVTVTDPLQFGIGPDYILREIGREEFSTSIDSSVGEMKEVYVLLEFDKSVDNYLLEAWLRKERQTRLASVSRVAALSLTGLAAIYGLLRFDTWSKGYYSRQLLVGGTLAIIALVVVLLQ